MGTLVGTVTVTVVSLHAMAIAQVLSAQDTPTPITTLFAMSVAMDVSVDHATTATIASSGANDLTN